MAPIQYIAVPVGTAGGPEWRGVIARHSEAGYKIFWCASVLAELAAKADQGGLLAFASGQPKTALDLCGELGVEAAWAAETLFPALERLGEGHWREEEGAWVCTSPMILRTLEWRGDAVATKALPAPKTSGKLQFSEKLSQSEYKAWRRTCRLPAGVSLIKPCPKRAKEGAKSCPVLAGKRSVCPNSCPDLSVLSPDSENGHKRTDEAEDAYIVENDGCPFSSQQKTKKREVKKQQQEANPDTPVVVFDQPPQNIEAAEALLSEMPEQARSATLLSLLAQCLDKGAAEKELLHKINKAKGKSNPGGYLFRDLTEYVDGTDFDAVKKEEEHQKARQKESYEAAKRAEAERQEQVRETDRRELLARQKRFFSLPEPERQVLEDQARRQCAAWNRPDPDQHSLVSMALDILDGLVTLQPQDNIGIYA